MLNLDLINRSSIRLPRKFIGWWLEHTVILLSRQLPAGQQKRLRMNLVIAFIDEKKAGALNHKFRGRKYATDILSFEATDEESLGELVLCPQVIKRQGPEHGLSFNEELGYLLIHGVLHLLGYDHESGGLEAKKMFAIQDRIFELALRALEKKNKLVRPTNAK